MTGVGIVGVGNCASALVQGVHYYRDAKETEVIPGLMHVRFGDYHIRDVRFVGAFDINREKIEKDLSEAIFVEPNCCVKFANPLPRLGVRVLPGPVLDGVGSHMKEVFKVEEDDPIDVASALREADADMLINFLPVETLKEWPGIRRSVHRRR